MRSKIISWSLDCYTKSQKDKGRINLYSFYQTDECHMNSRKSLSLSLVLNFSHALKLHLKKAFKFKKHAHKFRCCILKRQISITLNSFAIWIQHSRSLWLSPFSYMCAFLKFGPTYWSTFFPQRFLQRLESCLFVFDFVLLCFLF